MIVDQVRCSLGRVLNLSASGMRVSLRGNLTPEERASCEIDGPDGRFSVSVRVKWVKRSGLFTREAGLQFLDLSPRARESLASIACLAGIGTTIAT
ncbi:MAG: PilZ domain-containing protein [Planctomycetota bacterium]|nr:PilZ domain-containing protein [Planctomycetota bacterium]